MALQQEPPKKIVLAYSGGLDTSVILPWLKERYQGVKLVAFAAELGQGDELSGIEKKAYESGADEVVVMDLREEFAEKYCFPMLRAHAVYEQDYLLGTSIARPLIAAKQVEVAHQTGADAVGHGATGKGNDQVRFELTYMALDPKLKIIAPWKDPSFELRDRESAIDYAQKHNVPIPVSKTKIYSQDRNLWHISHEGAEIEHPEQEPNWAKCLTMTVPPDKAPDQSELVEVEFQSGNPVAVNGQKLSPGALIAELNKIGGRHGVGIALLVENRLVGMKSRGVYETPGGTILYEAHKALEQICVERDTLHYKQQIVLRYAELVYNGQWFHPLREALQTFVDHTNATVTGVAKVRLFKGRAMAVAAQSPHTLYDPQLASFSMEGYDVTAARGFIDLFGLPMKVASQAKALVKTGSGQTELGPLLKAFETAARSGGRLVLDKCFHDYMGPTTLVLERLAGRDPEPSSFVIVRCNVPHGAIRFGELPADVTDITFSRDHPLLLPYRRERYEIYLAGRAADPEAAYASIRAAITRLVGDWLRPEKFVGSVADGVKLLAGGHGLLGVAPLSLATAIRDTLAALGCRASLLPETPLGGSSFDESQLNVLSLFPAATLLVNSITCRRTTDSKNVAELVRKNRGW